MNYLLYVGVIIYIYLTTSVASKIGISLVGTFSSLIIILLFIQKFFVSDIQKLTSKFKEEFYIILSAIAIIIFRIILINDFDSFNQVIFFLIVPMTLCILLGSQNGLNKKKIKNLILFFFITECFLSFYERLFLINIFPYTDELTLVENWNFRSTGFLGHPLANALCVSIIMGFILASPIKLINKLFLFIIGYISLLCFNARGAILVWSILAPIYMISLIRNKKTKKSVAQILVLFLFSAIWFMYMLIVNYGWGGRLIHDQILDGSAKTRLNVFDAFSFINNNDFWLGNPSNYIPIMEKLSAGGIENSFIVVIINYGIVMFVILCVIYYSLIKKLLGTYSTHNKILIIISFIIVGSMNNSLATALPWGFFILCANTFPFIGKTKINGYYLNKNRYL